MRLLSVKDLAFIWLFCRYCLFLTGRKGKLIHRDLSYASFAGGMGRQSAYYREKFKRLDTNNANHGFVEPDTPMQAAEYQNALASTRNEWAEDEKL